MAPTRMKAAVLHGAGDLRVEDVAIPKPGPGEVLVRVRACGICASDVHYFEHGRIGRYVVDRPLILGHEVAGDVAATGVDVTSIAVGTRVAVEPGVSCGRCALCRSGRYNLCPDVAFYATPPVDGALAEYIVARADAAHPIPDDVTYAAAALCEPLSVGIHCAALTRVRPGDDVVVHGCGPIGLLAIVALRQRGARSVIATDVIPIRLEIAESFGAVPVDGHTGDPARVVAAATGGLGVDAVIDTSGVRSVIEAAPSLVRRGGAIAVVGLPHDDRVTYHMLDIVDKELAIHGVFRYANTYRAAIALVATRSYPIERVITHRFGLDDVGQAVDVAGRRKDVAIKVMIEL